VRGTSPKQPTVLIAANVAILVATTVLVPAVGPQTADLVAVPILLAGLWFGQRAGILAALLNVAAALVIVTVLATLSSTTEMLFRIGIGLVLGAVGGRFGEMQRRMVEETQRSATLQEAYDDTKSRFQILAETATDGIVSVDVSGIITYANPAVQRILGYEPSYLVGRPLTVLMPEELRSMHTKGFERYLTTGDRSLDWRAVEVAGMHADGRRVPLELSFGEYRRDDEPSFTGIIRDITDRKQAQEERERLMSSKDELIASVSHELRTPLTAVVGYARVLELGHDDMDEDMKRELVTLIADQADDLSFIVEDLLAAARAESGQLTVSTGKVDLLSEVKRVVGEGVRRSDGKEFDPTVVGASVIALADSGRVRQVLRNLLSNAARYGTEPVIVDVDSSESDAAIRIVDHGAPISREDQSLIFEPFHRLNPDRGLPGSVGLGLSVSRMLARLMGGDIVYTREGDQSVFTFTLPLAG
jgi:PAS domain S-box-containing protein